MAFEYWDVVFIAGFLGLFIGVLLGAVAFGIKWFLKILVNEGGYNYYKLITKSGALRCVGNKKVFPFPRNYHGEPSDVFKTFEVDWMTELIGKKGKAVELEKDNFEVFEGLEKKHSIVIDGIKHLNPAFYKRLKQLRKDKDHYFNLLVKNEFELNKLRTMPRKEFEQFMKDHKQVNRSGPIITKGVPRT